MQVLTQLKCMEEILKSFQVTIEEPVEKQNLIKSQMKVTEKKEGKRHKYMRITVINVSRFIGMLTALEKKKSQTNIVEYLDQGSFSYNLGK